MKALQDLQPPTSLRQLRCFLGLLNYYRRFIPHCADLLSPLSDLFRNRKKKNEQISLNDIQLKAFNEVKQKLASTSLLAHPVPDAQFSLVVDASGTAVGAVLQQHHHQQLQPLAYFSRQLKPAEQRYSTFGRELAMYLAVKHFQHSLKGRQFCDLHWSPSAYFRTALKAGQVFSSRNPPLGFCFAVYKRYPTYLWWTECCDRRLVSPSHQFSVLTFGYQFTADGLRPATSGHLGLLSPEFATCKFAYLPVPTADTQIICDTLTDAPRPFVSMTHRRVVFDTLHHLAHPGPKATMKRISARFFWPNTRRDITAWTRSCVSCQKSKVHKYIRAPFGTFSIPDARFSHVHIDLIGPWPVSQGFTYLLTCIDRFTRWPKLFP